jgi:hypothetical protein
VLDRWSWLFPRILAGALGGFVAAATAGAGPAAPPRPVEAPGITLGPDAGPEPIVVVISRSKILVGEDATLVVPLPAREALVTSGVDAKYKRYGPSDLFVVPLAEALTRAGEATPGSAGQPREAILIADASTPYRLLIEVLFTLGQSDVGKYHLMVARKKQ